MATRSRTRAAPAPTISLPANPAATPPAAPTTRFDRAEFAAIALVCATTAAVYAQVAGHHFVDFDDGDYVARNLVVRNGLTGAGMLWAFTSFEYANWHPLTWLSHMLDIQLFGLVPGRMLLMNLALHVASSVVLLRVLRRMTGRLWPSALVAALFALHPLHVESVAWIAERKDVLSGLFWMLTLGAYARWVEQPSRVRYGAVLLALALGLMAKPMLVTLPCVLLLLDLWPFRRLPWHGTSWAGFTSAAGPLVLEKLPLFGLVAVSSAITYVAQQTGGAVQSLVAYPLPTRVANAALACVAYMSKAIWPVGLAAFYPYPRLQSIEGAAAGVLLAALSAGALWMGARRPWLMTGWLWFLGTLVPVIGLVQVGRQAMADRYSYVPLIGLFLALAWQLAEIGDRRPALRGFLGIAAGIVVLVLAARSHEQVGFWRDRYTLFTHALAVTDENSMAHGAVGDALRAQGRNQEAVAYYSEAVRIDPRSFEQQINLGNILVKVHRVEEALPHYASAAALVPHSAIPLANTALAHLEQGKLPEAIDDATRALALQPAAPEGHRAMGLALQRQGRLDLALPHLLRFVEARPNDVDGLVEVGLALAQSGRVGDALPRFQVAARIDPARADAVYYVGYSELELGRLPEAVAHFSEAVRLKPDYANAWNDLSVALFREGRKGESASALAEARRLRRAPQAPSPAPPR